MNRAIDVVLAIILTLLELVLAAVGIADAFLAAGLAAIGVPPHLQIAFLIVFALLLMLLVLRAFGGVFAALLILLLVLLIGHRLLPGMHLPQGMVPPQFTPPGVML